MPLLSKTELNNLVGQSYKSATFSKSLNESEKLERVDGTTEYDIFLSHSYLDKETIFQLNYLLEEEMGLEVFVDWIEKPELDRSEVTPETASELRDAMDRSASLVYAISANSSASKWMPWELGYSDAKHGRVAILPITSAMTTAIAYQSQEFVGLYPYIDIADMQSGGRYLWVNDPNDWRNYALFKSWRNSGQLIRH